MKYLVAMSGGVDSSAAALILKESGHYIEGGIMMLSPFSDGADISSAKAVCGRLGIKLNVFDKRREFEQNVIRPFCSQYLQCKTPNPCIFCNRTIKFGAFVSLAETLGFDGIATGHYAGVIQKNGRYAIREAACVQKDQSYFLWNIPQTALSKAVFPLADIKSKDEVRNIARSAGLQSAGREDSQDICFVENGKYADFIEEYTGIRQPQGDFVDKNGRILGKHNGLLHYTIGQRRNLGVSLGERMFVISKHADSNTVVLGENKELYTDRITAENVCMQLYPGIEKPEKLYVRIRFGKNKSAASVTATDKGSAYFKFDEMQRAPAPGQSVVFYAEDTVVGGGYIC